MWRGAQSRSGVCQMAACGYFHSAAVTEGGVLFTWVANVTNVRLVLITANYIVLTGNNIARARGVSGSCRTRAFRATNRPHDGWVGLNSSEFLP